MRFFVALLFVFFYSTSHAFTFGSASPSLIKPQFLEPDQAFQLSMSPPSEGELVAHWQISAGYYLYQEQFSLSQDSTQPNPANKKNPLSFTEFPQGKLIQDPYFGSVIVYRDQLSLSIKYDAHHQPGTQIKAVLRYQGCADQGLCYAPIEHAFQFTVPEDDVNPKKESPKHIPTALSDSSTIQTAGALPSQMASIHQLLNSSLSWTTLATLFGLGLLLSLTPCVLPMIPIVSAIVVGTQHSRMGGFYYSMVYVLGMALTYAGIGGLVGFFGVQLNLQASLQNPTALLLSAVIFVVLAMAMFGVYDLRLPHSWQQKLQISSTGNATSKTTISVFLAGIASTLIVSPCISAPLAGALLFISSQDSALQGAVILFVMALGMSVPLLLVGLFGPRILPKNGEWLHDIKVVMGFALLAMSIWLLTRWLPASSHLFMWGGLALSISGYFIHRALKEHSHPVRWFLALLFMTLGMMTFMGGALGETNPLQPLKRLQPSSSEVGFTHNRQPIYHATVTSLKELEAIIVNQDSRPIVLDFYADWCVSCKAVNRMLASSELSPQLSQARLIKIDVTQNSLKNKAIMREFNIVGPPSLVFMNSQGQEYTQLTIMGTPTTSSISARLDVILTL